MIIREIGRSTNDVTTRIAQSGRVALNWRSSYWSLEIYKKLCAMCSITVKNEGFDVGDECLRRSVEGVTMRREITDQKTSLKS